MLAASRMTKTVEYNHGVMNLVSYVIQSARYDYILSKIEYETERIKLQKMRAKSPKAMEFYNFIKTREAEVTEKKDAYLDAKAKFTRLHLAFRKDARLYDKHDEAKSLMDRKKAAYLADEDDLEKLKTSAYALSSAYRRYAYQEEFTKIKEDSMKENQRFFRTELFDSALAVVRSEMGTDEYIAELDKSAMDMFRQFQLHPEYLKQFKQRMKNYEENGSIIYDFN